MLGQMHLVAKILTALVALEHAYILVLQMFLWTRPVALRAFSMTRETAEASARLAKNQGLYNGFLAAGLLWSLVPDRRSKSRWPRSFSGSWWSPASTAV